MCVYHTHTSMCMPSSLEGQKKALGFLELELQIVMGHHVGAKNHTWVFCKSRQCS